LSDRIADNRKYDGYGAGLVPNRFQTQGRDRDDRIGLHPNKLSGTGTRASLVSASQSKIDLEVNAFGPSELRKSVPDSVDTDF
jgi:hypothetical protein